MYIKLAHNKSYRITRFNCFLKNEFINLEWFKQQREYIFIFVKTCMNRCYWKLLYNKILVILHITSLLNVNSI